MKKFKESALLPEWYKLKVGESWQLSKTEISQLPFSLSDIRDDLEYYSYSTNVGIYGQNVIEHIYGQIQIGSKVFRIGIDCYIRVNKNEDIDNAFIMFLANSGLRDYDISMKRVRSLDKKTPKLKHKFSKYPYPNEPTPHSCRFK